MTRDEVIKLLESLTKQELIYVLDESPKIYKRDALMAVRSKT